MLGQRDVFLDVEGDEELVLLLPVLCYQLFRSPRSLARPPYLDRPARPVPARGVEPGTLKAPISRASFPALSRRIARRPNSRTARAPSSLPIPIRSTTSTATATASTTSPSHMTTPTPTFAVPPLIRSAPARCDDVTAPAPWNGVRGDARRDHPRENNDDDDEILLPRRVQVSSPCLGARARGCVE